MGTLTEQAKVEIIGVYEDGRIKVREFVNLMDDGIFKCHISSFDKILEPDTEDTSSEAALTKKVIAGVWDKDTKDTYIAEKIAKESIK